MAVMQSAPERNVLNRRFPSDRPGYDMVILEECAGIATLPARADECASSAVTRPHGALYLGGDVSRIGRCVSNRARPVGLGVLMFRELVQQQGECAVDY